MLLYFFLGRAAICAPIKAAARGAALHDPWLAFGLPQRCEQNIGIAGIEGDVDATRFGVFVEDLLPGFATIASAENSALVIIAEGMAERGHEGNVWIFGMDDQAADRVRVLQADKVPSLAGVDRFVNAVATDDVAADASLARAHVNHVGIRFGNSNGADGG